MCKNKKMKYISQNTFLKKIFLYIREHLFGDFDHNIYYIYGGESTDQLFLIN